MEELKNRVEIRAEGGDPPPPGPSMEAIRHQIYREDLVKKLRGWATEVAREEEAGGTAMQAVNGEALGLIDATAGSQCAHVRPKLDAHAIVNGIRNPNATKDEKRQAWTWLRHLRGTQLGYLIDLGGFTAAQCARFMVEENAMGGSIGRIKAVLGRRRSLPPEKGNLEERIVIRATTGWTGDINTPHAEMAIR